MGKKSKHKSRKDAAAGTRPVRAVFRKKVFWLLMIGLLGFGAGAVWYLRFTEPVIAAGISIGHKDGIRVELGGMTRAEAQNAVAELEKVLAQTPVVVEREEREDWEAVRVTCMLADLGWHLEQDYVERALQIGNSGGLLKRYREQKAARAGEYTYPLTGALSPIAVEQWLVGQKEQFRIVPVNAGVGRADGRFCYTEHRQGSSLLISETGNALSKAAKNPDIFVGNGQIRITAILQPELPAVTTEDAMRCDTLIGSYSTSYRMEGETENARANNLKNGAAKLNRTVLYPGEELSCAGVLGPFTQENGYLGAGSYAGGKIVESIGGGVCQISSTLYNAVLEAELTVTERSSHSMTVGYVPLGRDAAIAWEYKDFKFQNSSDTPIYIEAEAWNGTLKIMLWGKENGKTGREVRFESVIVQELEPGADIVTEDSSLPAGYRQVTQTARTGYEVKLYKIILIDGKESARELVNTSRYAAEPAHVTVGTSRKQ